MKTLFTAIIMFVLMSSVTPEAQAVITINTMGNIQLGIVKQAGVSSYSDASPGWVLAEYGKISVTDDGSHGTFVGGSAFIPSSVVLTRQGGSETLTLGLACRMWPTFMSNKNEGVACDTGTTLDNTLWHGLSFFPTSATFSSGSATGKYVGTLVITVNYL